MDTQMRVAFEDAVKCGGGEMWINIVNIVAFWVSNFSLDKRDAIQKSTAPCLYFEVHQMMEGEEGGRGEKRDGDWWGGAGVVDTTGHAVVTAAAHTNGKSQTASQIRLWAQRIVRAEELIGNHVCGLRTNSVTGPQSGSDFEWVKQSHV